MPREPEPTVARTKDAARSGAVGMAAMARSLTENPPTVEEAKLLLKALRWDVDMVITNYDGERVWLGPCLNSEGKRIGITDCCLERDPCAHHRALASAHEETVAAPSAGPADSLVDAIEGNLSGMAHGDLVLTCEISEGAAHKPGVEREAGAELEETL